jgi:hypothetical protein
MHRHPSETAVVAVDPRSRDHVGRRARRAREGARR